MSLETRLSPLSPLSPSTPVPRRGARPWLARALSTPRGMLLALFGLHLLTVGGVLLATEHHNQQVLTRHAQEVMTHVTDAAETGLRRHLEPARQITLLLRDGLEQGVIGFEQTDPLEQALLTLLRGHSQVSGVFVARPNGDFLFVQRSEGGYLRKQIRHDGAERSVELLRRSSDLRPLERTLDDSDRYRPQTRAWYLRAVAAQGPAWTAPYTFFSSGRLGITVALARRSPSGKLLEVVGVDIRLDDLARFLDRQPIGAHGRAFLATEDGQLITVPDGAPGEAQALPRLEKVGGLPQALLGQAATVAPQSLYRLRQGQHDHLGMVRPLALDQDLGWRMGVYAPRQDFTGPLERMNTLNLLVLLGGGGVLLLLALPLLRRLEQPFHRLSRFERVFEQALHLQALLHPDGRVLEVNGAALERLPVAPREVRGQLFWETPWWAGVSGIVLERLHHAIDQAAAGQGGHSILSLEDGQQLELSVRPLAGEGGETELVLLEVRDITERRQHEAALERQSRLLSQQNTQLEQRSAELARADAFKTRTLGIVSHDLKNPIATVTGFADLIVEQAPDPEIRAWAGHIVQAGRRMHDLVLDLLDHTALESGQMRLERRALDFSALIEDLLLEHQPAAQAKGQRLEAQLVPGVRLEGDVRRLTQVLDNLISNAVKFTPPGGQIRLRLYPSRREGVVYLAVQDSGPGLSIEDREKAFGLFQTLSARPTGGESSSGLGLALARQMAELHGGSLSVDSTPGQGATFTLRLPMRAAQPA